MIIINLTDIIFAVLLIISSLVYAATLLIDYLNSKQCKRKRTERDESMRALRAFVIVGTIVCLTAGIICAFTGQPVIATIFTLLLIILTATDIIITIKDHH